MAEARTRYELFGKVSSGADVWSTGFYGGASSALSAAQLLANAEHVFDDFMDDIWNDAVLETYWAAETTLDGCRVRDIGADNITARVATHVAATPVPGTDTNPQLPGEVAEVVSLLTGVAGGRGRGRMYLPPMGVITVAANGTLGPTRTTVLANGMQEFFQALNARPSNEFPGVVSMYSGAAGVLRPITDIRVGNVFDSQRRRRNTQLETYTTRTL